MQHDNASGSQSDMDAPAGASEDVSQDWRSLLTSDQPQVFYNAWLSLLCRSIDRAHQAALFLSDPESGELTPVARWGAGSSTRFSEGAVPLVTAIVKQGQSAAQSHAEDAFAGHPIDPGDPSRGVVIVQLAGRDRALCAQTIRTLQWGAPWVRQFLAKTQSQSEDAAREHAGACLEILSAVSAMYGMRSAASMLVNELAARLQCQRVSFVTIDNGRGRLLALSQTSQFDRRMDLGQAIEAAAEEAADQDTTLLWPAPDGVHQSFSVTVKHQALQEDFGAIAIATLPVLIDDHIVAVVCLERLSEGKPFDQKDLDFADAIVAVAGPAVMDKRDQDASLPVVIARRFVAAASGFVGPGHVASKVTASVIAVLIVLSLLVHGDFRVTADATLQGELHRAIGAPFDGYLRSEHARAGDIVKKTDLMATLEDNELTLRRLRSEAERRQHQLERDRALARGDVASANISGAQVAQAKAQITLLDQMLGRTEVRAPFDAVVVKGDLSQSVGKPVSRGETLFELAPLDKYRLTLVVPEGDIRYVEAGQKGQLLLSAFPEEGHAFTVRQITPVAQSADGMNGFVVKASLDKVETRFRPGLEGVAKIQIDRRPLVWIWTRGALRWLRLTIWSVWP